MSILSGILGNYGDDMFRAASNVAANKADDALLKAAKNKVDDIALKSAKKATKSSATQKKLAMTSRILLLALAMLEKIPANSFSKITAVA